MRILVAIPHYYHTDGPQADDGRPHASTGDARPAERIEALSACIAALHQNFGPSQRIINLDDRSTRPVNELTGAGSVDVVVCTTRGRHLVEQLELPPQLFRHRSTDAEPLLLGYECRVALRERLGDYDFYCYLEDDLIVRDPWTFRKLTWFTDNLGDACLLQPNRYETTRLGVSLKAYVDGDIPVPYTAEHQDVSVAPTVLTDLLGVRVAFRRPTNPHAGCYFLNARQMATWADRDDFLDRSTAFVGPLESAATLGIMRAFRVYKPDAPNAAFFEIEHHGTGFIGKLRFREPGD